jgi:hypothetical protein
MREATAVSIFGKLAKKQQDMITFCNFTREKLLTMRKEFDGFDTDKSGAIDAKELEAALRNLGEFKSKAQLDEIMAEADEVRWFSCRSRLPHALPRSVRLAYLEFCAHPS